MKSSYRHKTELNMKFNSSKMSIRIREQCSWNILFKLFDFIVLVSVSHELAGKLLLCICRSVSLWDFMIVSSHHGAAFDSAKLSK